MRTGREMLRKEEEEKEQRQSPPAGLSPQDEQSYTASTDIKSAAGVSEDAPLQASASGGAVLGSAVGMSTGGGDSAMLFPMVPHRRLRQAILLAHKLLKKEAELEAARRELVQLQQRYVRENRK